MLKFISAAATLAVVLLCLVAPAAAQSRVALVIGNSAYQNAPALNTTAADAALIADTLQDAGFAVVQANDVTATTIGDSFATFISKLQAAGPNAVAFIYYAGYGAQFEGDSYLVPVDAQIQTAADVPNASLSLNDIIQALAPVPAAARIIVLDASRDGGFGSAGNSPLTPGLALVGVPDGFLIAYAAAPGAVICPCGEQNAANSAYAASLATLLRQPGLDISQVLDGVRLQVNQASGGAQMPWMVSALEVEVKLFQATTGVAQTLLPAFGVANIPVPPLSPPPLTQASFQGISADQAYQLAIEEDSLQGYEWFVQAFPHYRLAGQIWDIIQWRRESILWHRTLMIGTVSAYWNYLYAYPHGLYAREAGFWLRAHSAALPPPNYVPVVIPLPPGYSDELVGIVWVEPQGYRFPAAVFGDVRPIYVAPAAPWTPPRPVIVVRPPPPPPPRAAIVTAVTPMRRVSVVQPLQPAVNPRQTPQQLAERQRALQAYQERLKQQNEQIAKTYHAPAVIAPINVSLPGNNPPAKRPAGIQIPNSALRGPAPATQQGKPAIPSTASRTPPATTGKEMKPVIPNTANRTPAPAPATGKEPMKPVAPSTATRTPTTSTGKPGPSVVSRPPERSREVAHPPEVAHPTPPQKPAVHPAEATQPTPPPQKPAVVQHPTPPQKPAEHPVQQTQQRPAPQVAAQKPPAKPAPPAPHPAGCPAGEHMVNGHCVR